MGGFGLEATHQQQWLHMDQDNDKDHTRPPTLKEERSSEAWRLVSGVSGGISGEWLQLAKEKEEQVKKV